MDLKPYDCTWIETPGCISEVSQSRRCTFCRSIRECRINEFVAGDLADDGWLLVAKNPSSIYEPGKRSGSWKKLRINRGQEFVIGGYTIGGNGFDALIFGYYDETGLRFAAKTRNGFTSASRSALIKKMTPLLTDTCPFLGLPERRAGRWGQGITAEKMKDCRWLRPLLVGQFEFVEWTPDAHLRHSTFVGFREDKDPRDVVREP
jgi:ATP-dependent DNA ligase